MKYKYRLVKIKSFVLDKTGWDYSTFKFDSYKYHIQKIYWFGWRNFLDNFECKDHGLRVLDRLKLETQSD